MFFGIASSLDLCHPAPSRTSTAWLPGATCSLKSSRCRFISVVFARWLICPTASSRAGHAAEKR